MKIGYVSAAAGLPTTTLDDIVAHYQRLIQRHDRPMPKMQALGACMTKFLLYAFAVMHKRRAFEANHVWEEERRAA